MIVTKGTNPKRSWSRHVGKSDYAAFTRLLKNNGRDVREMKSDVLI